MTLWIIIKIPLSISYHENDFYLERMHQYCAGYLFNMWFSILRKIIIVDFIVCITWIELTLIIALITLFL